MEIRAKAKYIRMSPKKVRLAARLLYGLDVEEALNQLKFIGRKAKNPLSKVISSAIANALTNAHLEKENLYIKKITVDEGPTLKRWRPRAYGRAAPIRKRSSHISVVLEEISPTKKKAPRVKPQKLEKPLLVKSHKALPKEEELPEKREALASPERSEESPEVFDVRRKGTRRLKEHLDKVRLKKPQELLRKIFRRKAV